MKSTRSTGNLGKPVEASLAAIDKELILFWESAGEGHGGVMRACSCNLLAVVGSREQAEAFPAVLVRLSEWHPSRSIVAYMEPGEGFAPSGASGMRAWISAQCSKPIAGGPQVCCEAITIAARGRAIMDLPNALLALLVPDLPVYLYWRSFKIADRDLVERMARFSHLLIVDSHQSREDARNRFHLLQLLIDQPAGIAMRDLNWSRITAWRDLIAQFFDAADTRDYLQRIVQVEITRNLSAPGSIPTRTLLLTGWLASRLGWKRISAERSGDQWLSRWTGNSHEVRVSFTGTVSEPGQVPGISSVTLRTQDNAEFSVLVEEGSSCLTARASIEGSPLTHSVPQEPLDEASLLIRELSQTGEDLVFKEALKEALELEKSFLR
jgi:glucose-6-phosphate dehydrogenase assembly protein OpcA